jgi:hypothetical protein
MIFLLCALSGVALGASAAPAADQYAAVKVHTLSTWYVSPAAAAAAVSQPALAYTHSRSLFLSLFLWLANVTHRAHAVGVFALVLGALLFYPRDVAFASERRVLKNSARPTSPLC